MRKIIILTAVAIAIAGGAEAQTYQVGQTVDANMGSGPWLACVVVKHNEKQTDYEVRCPGRQDTFRAADDADHIRPHSGGALPAAARALVAAPAPRQIMAQTPLPALGPAPARSASNVLLGRWKLTDGECNSLILEFSPHQSRDYNKASGGYAAYWGQRAVESYVRSAKQVFVVVANAGHATVNIKDANHIVPESMFQCTYTRM